MGGGGPNDRGTYALPTVVADASPLIGLTQIGRLGLLPDHFGAVLVPPAVSRETIQARRLEVRPTRRRPSGRLAVKRRPTRCHRPPRPRTVVDFGSPATATGFAGRPT